LPSFRGGAEESDGDSRHPEGNPEGSQWLRPFGYRLRATLRVGFFACWLRMTSKPVSYLE